MGEHASVTNTNADEAESHHDRHVQELHQEAKAATVCSAEEVATKGEHGKDGKLTEVESNVTQLFLEEAEVASKF